jgi:hypothetical protein
MPVTVQIDPAYRPRTEPSLLSEPRRMAGSLHSSRYSTVAVEAGAGALQHQLASLAALGKISLREPTDPPHGRQAALGRLTPSNTS